MKKTNNICVFDIKNLQQEYAYTLEFIELCEFEDVTNSTDERLKKLINISNRILISGGITVKGTPVRYFEKPIEKVTQQPEKNVVYKNGIEKLTELKSNSINERTLPFFMNKEMLYHIRVHLNKENLKTNLINLVYLALMLQKLEKLFLGLSDAKKRLSVFIVPIEDAKCPYVHNVDETYFDINNIIYESVSRYLRLLSKEYAGILYSAIVEGKKVNIKPLNNKMITKSDVFFPAVIVDKYNYFSLFEKKVTSEEIRDLFMLGIQDRFRNASNSNPEVALCDYIGETSFRRLQKNVEFQLKKLKEIENKILSEAGIAWVQFAVFCFIFQQDLDADFSQNINLVWDNAYNLYIGIKQIVQNSIQHSEKKSCIFSLVFRDSGENLEQFMKEIDAVYEDTSFVWGSEKKCRGALEIIVADINYKQTMVDNFVDNLSWEYNKLVGDKELAGHKRLIYNKGKISIRNFFSEFEDKKVKDEWRVFREQDISAHIGLLLFNTAIQRCNASVKVYSGTSYVQSGKTEYYYKPHGNSEKKDTIYKPKGDNHVIPGTQFTILIPLVPAKKLNTGGLGQLNAKDKIEENYQTFAEYIRYREEKLEFEDVLIKAFNNIEREEWIASSKDKFEFVQNWKKNWEYIIQQNEENKRNKKYEYNDKEYKPLFYIDIGEIEEKIGLNYVDNVEVFIKGFLEVIPLLPEYNIFSLAFIRADLQFVKVFRDTCIAFATRKFPNNVQIFVSEKECVDNLWLFGETYFHAIANGYIMSMEHGSKIIGAIEYITAKDLCENIGILHRESSQSTKVIPFDVILSCGENKGKKIFDKRMHKLANHDIDAEVAGFLIRNTHMRLGSKVHIQSFYEMAFLFYRTAIANRIAFEILQDLYMKESFQEIDIEKDKLIFFGYASYSKAVLTSLVEILKEYRKNGMNISFVSYQHNLQSESEDIQMYFGFENALGIRIENGKMKCDEEHKIVNVVPISSTLTTFEKMWSRLKKSMDKSCEMNFSLCANYTVFWVTNENEGNSEKPTKIEKNYWKKADIEKQTVVTNFIEFEQENTTNLIHYSVRCPVVWQHPLDCNLCYPRQLLDEIPLVETDQTSTVPTQQIRKYKPVITNVNCDKNNERIKELKGCVSYGHIVRDQNHFQYYIDTQKYFYKVKNDVKAWLLECSKVEQTKNSLPIMHIIFSPEHNTNVGFAQYVNTYYFEGMAEIVSINEDKEYRSNFECEHAALIETIADLFRYTEIHSIEDLPVKFYYVDDTIISGETFQKANSFLRSLLPQKYKNNYGTNLINKIFLLVDRLSRETKKNYVRDIDKDFHSYLHIDISNMRTQGDSCVGCKLKQNAIKLFKRSSTRKTAHFWAEKISTYQPIQYDDKKRMELCQTDNAYYRMVISHIVQNTIFINNDSYKVGNAYDVILLIAFKILKSKSKKQLKEVAFCFDELIGMVNEIEGIKILLKVISRPFFSFDFKIKMQVQTLIIVLTEVFVGNTYSDSNVFKPQNSNGIKQFVCENQRIELTNDLAKLILKKLKQNEQLAFLQDVLLECLTDMRSTYILRKDTIKNVYRYICDRKYDIENAEIFWEKYVRNVQRIIHCSNDEMRSLNLEHLLLSGLEYQEFKEKHINSATFMPRFLYQEIAGIQEPESRDPFYVFCHEILLQNTRILFDGIEKDIEREQSSDTYFMEQWRYFRCLEKSEIYNGEYNSIMPLRQEKELFQFLEAKEKQYMFDSNYKVKDRYEEFLNKFVRMIAAKYKLNLKTIKLALLTRTPSEKQEALERAEIEQMDILSAINLTSSEERFDIKQKIVEALNKDSNTIFSLEEDGYTIEERSFEKESSYLIVCFDNPEEKIQVEKGRTLKPIAKVFLYLEIQMSKEKMFYYLRLILRDLFTYRNRILRILENDFAGDMFIKYAHTIGEKNIIAHEKATSHNNTFDNEKLLGFLIDPNVLKKYDNLDLTEAVKWLLMRSYVNEQIAKLFNRNFQDRRDNVIQPSSPDIPVLYVDENAALHNEENQFNKRLYKFTDFNFIMDDRFNLLESVIEIEYRDLLNVKFITSKTKGYNVEFIKCVLIDIMFAAMKHISEKYEFLLQIDDLLGKRKILRNSGLYGENEWIAAMKSNMCTVEIYVEKSKNENFDFLVIKNPVYKIINDWEYKNRIIHKRLNDPLDFLDGHLSLYTIKRYIEGLREELMGKSEFKYYMDEKNKLWFVSKLPIVEKGDQNERNILD